LTQPPRARPEADGDAGTALPDQIFEGLVRLFFGARQHSQSLQRDFGVTAAQLSVLRILERRGSLGFSDLRALMFVRGSTLSGILDRLQARGLIARERSQADRRQVEVALTDGGAELLAAIPRGQTKFGALRQLVRELPREEAETFLETLDRMVALLGPQQEADRP